MILQKLIKLARNEAGKSSHKAKVGAVIFGRTIISTGHNQIRSVRSITKKFIKWPNSIHAEINAIIKSKVSLKGKSILVIRINKKGNLRLAKPCQHCQMYIDHVGITNVFYSTNDENVEQLL